jgi:hypothetical protein
MWRNFEATVAALCATIIRDRTGVREPGERLERTVQFVLGQHGRMPDYLRLPLCLLTLVFDWSGLLRGARFHRQDDAGRIRQLERWRQSRLAPCRDLIRFYESLVTLYWYSLTEDSTNERLANVAAAWDGGACPSPSRTGAAR